MSYILMFITNQVDVAILAEKAGVDWIFVDLEKNGKIKRQRGKDTFISKHKMEDILPIRKIITKSKLLVRVNPPHSNSKHEIDNCIESGADILMLPYFKKTSEVKEFIEHINGRTEVCLLLETKEAVNELDSILDLDGIDYIHIGLNDLSISYNMNFLFEPLSTGVVDEICGKISDKNIKYGFGGVARVDAGLIPGEKILCEHRRLGSTMAILSRSFCNINNVDNINHINDSYIFEVSKIRKVIQNHLGYTKKQLIENSKDVKEEVNKILSKEIRC